VLPWANGTCKHSVFSSLHAHVLLMNLYVFRSFPLNMEKKKFSDCLSSTAIPAGWSWTGIGSEPLPVAVGSGCQEERGRRRRHAGARRQLIFSISGRLGHGQVFTNPIRAVSGNRSCLVSSFSPAGRPCINMGATRLPSATDRSIDGIRTTPTSTTCSVARIDRTS
jgi:hypothetical protein